MIENQKHILNFKEFLNQQSQLFFIYSKYLHILIPISNKDLTLSAVAERYFEVMLAERRIQSIKQIHFSLREEKSDSTRLLRLLLTICSDEMRNSKNQIMIDTAQFFESNIMENIITDKELKKKLQKIVISQDNFIKMTLIFLRLQANLPVILMGETGIGKVYFNF